MEKRTLGYLCKASHQGVKDQASVVGKVGVRTDDVEAEESSRRQRTNRLPDREQR
jgi:hypothetical protein